MDDVGLVGLGKPLGDLRGIALGIVDADGAPAEERAQGFALDELHCDEESAIGLVGIMNGCDVWMSHCSCGAGLA